MDNLALGLIGVTLFLLVVIVGLLTLLIYKMFKQNNTFAPQKQVQPPTGEAPHPDISKDQFHPGIVERIKEIEKIKPKRADLFCPNHSEEPGETTCAICDKMYCKACIKPYKSLHFCKEHMPLIMRHEWDEVVTIKTSTQDPEQGVRLYDIKKEMLQNDDLPTYIETHYKINVDQDYIETYLVLFSMKENVQKVKDLLAHSIL